MKFPAPLPSQSLIGDVCRIVGWVSMLVGVLVAYAGLRSALRQSAPGLDGAMTRLADLSLAFAPILGGVLLLAVSEHLQHQRQMLRALHAIALRPAELWDRGSAVAPNGLNARASSPASESPRTVAPNDPPEAPTQAPTRSP